MILASADYASVEALKRHLAFSETPDDDFLAELIREASDLFSAETGRFFVPVTRTVQVEVPRSAYDHLEVPDTLALDSVGVSGESLNPSGYGLRPLSEFPATWLKRTGGDWTCGEIVTLAGTFGYHLQPSRMWRVAAVISADIDADTETIALGVSGVPAGIEWLDYIRIDDEVMQVRAITPETAPDLTTLTVTRGELGSEPAAHLGGEIIRKFDVYEPVRSAVILRAGHMYMTRKNPGVQIVAMPNGSVNMEAGEPRLVGDTVKALRREPFVYMVRA